MLAAGLCIVMAATAQWTIDSVNTAGLYPYYGGTATNAVFSNGGQWDVFDAVSGAHTFGNFTISRALISTVSYQDKVYFAGGKYGYFADPVYTKNVDVFDAATNSWSILSLSKNRAVGASAAAVGKIIFGGGIGSPNVGTPTTIYNTVDIFDASTGTRTTAKLSKGRANIAAGASGNKVVFAGGWFWDFNYNVLTSNAIDIYDVATNVWTKSTLSVKRENIAVAVVGSKIIFAGGTGGTFGGAVNNVDVYDASTDTWTTTALPNARYSLKSAVIGNVAYFAGGAFDPVENEVDLYNAVTGTWATIYMPTSLSSFSMTVINDKLYFAGGYISATAMYSDLVQIFDPATGTWSTQNLSLGRSSIGAVACGNKGYFAAGQIAYGYPLPVTTNRVDIYTTGAPEANFTASSTAITAGQSVNFTDQSTGSPTSWEWTFNGGTPNSSTEQNPSGIQYNTVGTFDVSLTVTNASGSSTVTKTGFISVTPAPCEIPTGFSTTNITATTATLNWNAVSGALKYKVSYKLKVGGTWINSTVVNPTWNITGLTPNTAYIWKVKSVCANNVTSAFSANQSFTTAPAKEGALSNAVQGIYPDPVTDQFRISLTGDVSWPLNCFVYDMYGRAVKTAVITDYTQSISAKELTPGNYFVTVVDSQNGRWSFKIVKQ